MTFTFRVPEAKPLRYLGCFSLVNVAGLLLLVPLSFLLLGRF